MSNVLRLFAAGVVLAMVHASCINNITPATGNSDDVCGWYADSTCCTTSQPDTSSSSSSGPCFVDTDCLEQLNLFTCRVCSPGVFEPKLFISGSVKTYNNFTALTATHKKILSFALRESTSVVLGHDGKLVGGNASDRALLEWLERDYLLKTEDLSITKEVLFNSSRKFSAVQLDCSRNQPAFLANHETTIIKGAPDLLLPKCAHYYNEDGKVLKLSSHDALNDAINQISKRGLRVIAIATSDSGIQDSSSLPAGKFTLVGIMGIMDELRPESKSSLELAKQAGIQVVMITGDRAETAKAVAEELGLLDNGKILITSTQLKTMSDEQLQDLVPRIGVIARALPTDKSRLVKVVGMTGDGVNDSAALMKADVGFAMGSGSEVAKEAADIVILDDNFASITQAVLYGRTILKSIRKFIVFQSTINVASLLIVFVGPFLGFDFPLTLIQLLWVNLVMDTLAALAFGGEPALKRYMHQPPVRRDEAIINPYMWSAILLNGAFVATMCVIALTYPPVRGFFLRDGKPSEAVFLTAFFAFFIFLSNFNALNVRTASRNLFDHLFGNRGFLFVLFLIFAVQIAFTYLGGKILRTVGLTYDEWVTVISAAMVILPFDLVRKSVVGLFLNRDY